MNEILGVRIVENREVARATRWITLEGELPYELEPGHIVVVYVPDLAHNWVRHPYTVSWAEPGRFSILYRVVRHGRTTPTMAEMGPGDTLRLGSRHGEPVRRLVGDAPRLVGVSTGVGVGPLAGYVRTRPERAITLVSGFREEADMVPVQGVDWRPTLTRPGPAWTGRVGRVDQHLAGLDTPETHWHLVGNGAMIVSVRAGLLGAGVPLSRLTIEVYFDKGAAPDPEVVARIAGR